jgi:hypothetical protein
MKTISRYLSLLAVLSVIIVSCQKEVSFEAGNNTSSDGLLLADITGTCTGVTLGGTYKKDTTLNSSHFVDVTVIVNTPGNYVISSDTINGYYFRGSGNFTATGSQVVRLNGNGKPLAAETNSFTVTYDSTQCEFSVTVVAGTGGTAVFTLNGAPNGCTGATVNGTYTVGTVLTSANTAVINVNVTAVGTYSISTTAVNGIVFSISNGTFTVTGPQTVTLTASGTPVAAGDFTITVTASGNTCTFIVTVSPVAVIDYFPRVANDNWSYEFDGDPNDSLLRKVISQTISAGGNVYNIFLSTDDASLGFDSSGYFRKTGSDYFEWIDMGSYLGYDSSNWMEYNFLKDNLPQGGTWNSAQFTGPVTPPGQSTVQITGRFGYRILQKDVSITVKGIAYPNTIVVEEKLWVLNPSTGSFQDVSASTGFYINYYSRNIGLIKQDYDDGAGLLFPLDLRRHAVY